MTNGRFQHAFPAMFFEEEAETKNQGIDHHAYK